MPAEMPFVTGREIAREFRLGADQSPASALRRLRQSGALSPGMDVALRGPGGRVAGRLHLYSVLNRDAAKALRHGDAAAATKLSKLASQIEQTPQAKRIASTLGRIESFGGAAHLVAALSRPDLTKDVAALELKQARARQRFAKQLDTVTMTGHITALQPAIALLDLVGASQPVALPRKTVEEAGLGRVGAAVCATWESLPGGRTLMSIEPAIDLPEVTAAGEPLVDLHGTPWGRLLSDPDALNASSPPTITLPEGIPDVA